MFCYKCSQVIPANSAFCPWCQAELFVSCPKCGSKYSSQYPSCNQCGTNRESYILEQQKLEARRIEEERRKEVKRQQLLEEQRRKEAENEARRREEERLRAIQIALIDLYKDFSPKNDFNFPCSLYINDKQRNALFALQRI